jgi:murein DD-endopeptidase MepM/ murein hydrolase activator NlpD
MTAEFTITRPVLTSEGAAYCPIERKRRGPAALAASMAVLIAGAGFLSFSTLKTPAPLPAPAIEQTARQVVIPIHPQTRETSAAVTQIEEPAEETELSIQQALAESRAARADIAPIIDDAATQSVLETRQAGVLIPRIKPAPVARLTSSPVIAARPLRLGMTMLASAEDAPPPVFFESDLLRTETTRTPAAITFVRDIERNVGETHIRITRGETFVDALKRAGVAAADRNEAAYAFGKHYNLRRLLPGQEFVLTLGWPNQTLFQLASGDKAPEARLLGLEFRADVENRILMHRNQSGALEAEKAPVALTTRTMSVAGRISGSLYLSAKSVGTPDMIIADLANAFSYDVDFQREIRGGDEFEAIFEVNYDDRGEMVSTGNILFAHLTWRGGAKEKGYYRFAADADGGRSDYYDATGQSAKRLLMKTPIDGARLSSGFGSRKHPILGYRRAHKGVDFAARRGTPIKAAGDGVIERANRYGSFGNYVLIRHANGYKTAYAHLKGFARGIRKGKRVDQGDIIAYVGTTGRSTGPHLHYEVHLRGKAVNPQRLKIAATGKNLKGADLDRFKAHRDMINAMRDIPVDEPDLLAKGGSTAKGAL